jgi:hypothetical protein
LSIIGLLSSPFLVGVSPPCHAWSAGVRARSWQPLESTSGVFGHRPDLETRFIGLPSIRVQERPPTTDCRAKLDLVADRGRLVLRRLLRAGAVGLVDRLLLDRLGLVGRLCRAGGGLVLVALV